MAPSLLEAAQTEKARADIAAAEALQRKLSLEADELDYEKHMRESSAFENRTFTFDDVVRDDSVQECIQVLSIWTRRDAAAPIKIIFNSPGGSVFDGFALYDYILQIRKAGTKVDTTSLGMTASMGGILLQSGETRRMSRHSYLMIHEVSATGGGKQFELEDEVKFTNRLQERCVAILAERSTMSVRQIKNKWKRKDWWLDAEEALKLGFCDEVE